MHAAKTLEGGFEGASALEFDERFIEFSDVHGVELVLNEARRGRAAPCFALLQGGALRAPWLLKFGLFRYLLCHGTPHLPA